MSDYITELRELLAIRGVRDKEIAAAVKYAENLISLNLPVIFDKQHLSLLIGVEKEILDNMLARLETIYYHEASIPKKNGGVRTLNVPSMNLKSMQRWILDNIIGKMYVSKYATGFCNKKSIVTNADIHKGKKCILNLDLEDFFPSITQKRVFAIFYYYGYTTNVSYLLSRLCTCDGVLPQGAPTSPQLSNIVCIKLDKRLGSLAEKYKADYSRYADDITFSGNTDLTQMLPIVKQIIEEEGFTLNEKKTRIAFPHQRQEVTGLIINGDKVRVPKKYIKQINQEIYYCKKFGVDNHLQHINCKKRFYREHMYGKAYFVYMVDREKGRKIIDELNTINWDWSVRQGRK